MREMGFNSVRLPYSDEMVISDPIIAPILLRANPDLIGKTAMDVYEAVVIALTDAGIAVFPNNHITTARWCCDGYPCDAQWNNDQYGGFCRISQTEEQWIEHWETVMIRFKDNKLVVGADLRNEVRALWGTLAWETWAKASEKAGKRLHAINPDWLIVVGGLSSNNDLTGVRRRPVVLPVANRVVYAAHVYAWSGWGALEGRYARRKYKSFAQAMTDNWGYILDNNIAPVWVNEFGAGRDPGSGDAHYWSCLMVS